MSMQLSRSTLTTLIELVGVAPAGSDPGLYTCNNNWKSVRAPITSKHSGQTEFESVSNFVGSALEHTWLPPDPNMLIKAKLPSLLDRKFLDALIPSNNEVCILEHQKAEVFLALVNAYNQWDLDASDLLLQDTPHYAVYATWSYEEVESNSGDSVGSQACLPASLSTMSLHGSST